MFQFLINVNSLSPLSMCSKVQEEANHRLVRGELKVYGIIADDSESKETISRSVYYDCESASDSAADELDIMAIREKGERKSTRKREQRKSFGYQIASDQIQYEEELLEA